MALLNQLASATELILPVSNTAIPKLSAIDFVSHYSLLVSQNYINDKRLIKLDKFSNYPHPSIQKGGSLSCNNKGVRIKANITTKRVIHNIP